MRVCVGLGSQKSWGKQGRSETAPLSALVGVAAGWSCRVVRVGAQWSQRGLGVRGAEHGKRSGLVHAVERRGLGRVEVTAGQDRSILRIVEPETQMERVRRSQAHIGVKAEDIIQKNRLDLDMAVIGLLANFDIGLIPGQTETPRKIGVLGAIGLKEAILDGEQVKRETRLDPIQVQNECVILLAPDYRRAGPRLLIRIGAKTVNYRRVRQQVESDLVLLILGGDDAGDRQHCQCPQQSTDAAPSGSAAQKLLTAIVVHFFVSPFFWLRRDR